MEERSLKFFVSMIKGITIMCILNMMLAIIILIISVSTISGTSGLAVMLLETQNEVRRVKTLGKVIEFNLEETDKKVSLLWKDVSKEEDIVEDALEKARAICGAIRNLGHEEPAKRTEAAFILKEHGAKFMLGDYGEDLKKDAVEGLIKNLEDKDWEARTAAAHALGFIRDKRAVPLLIKLLEKEGENQITMTVAAHALGEYGEHAQPAFDILAKLLDHENWEIRETAVLSLSRLKDKRAVPLITRMTEDENDEVKRAAKAGLETISTPEDQEKAGQQEEDKGD